MKLKVCSFFVSLALILSTLPLAFAIVDMNNANYSVTKIDIEVPGAASSFYVSRTYNSRSLFNGMFGFGWCSLFETRLEITPEGNLKIINCGDGQSTVYSPSEFNPRDIANTISQIVTAESQAMKLSQRQVQTLRKQLERDEMQRMALARKHGIRAQVREGTPYLASGVNPERIVFRNNTYTFERPDGTLQRFDSQGRLTHIFDKSNNFVRFAYHSNGTLQEVVDQSGRKLTFRYYPNGKVRAITGPNNLSAEYKYARMDDLVEVKNGWNNVYTYTYDDLHNLTRMNYPDGTFVALTYDKERDWVVSFRDREGCLENYTYEFSKREPDLHYWSNVKKTCGDEVVNESKYEFRYAKRASGENYLSRVVSTINNQVIDIIYHERLNRPIQIRRNNLTTTFSYNDRGLVSQKRGPLTTQSFDYDSAGRMARVKTDILDQKGKVISTRTTQFRYDDKSNLIFASSSEGIELRLDYDVRGRVVRIEDQAKRVLRVQYEERFSRPSLVTREGQGSIRITYKMDGEIDKVESREGPTVALQIASAFNNLLDMISPVTADIYN
jgi:YD repeat-containing protein